MPLPTFVVIGAAKSGTTSLHRYLRSHPEIFVTEHREPSFFAHEGQQLDFRGPGDDEWSFVTDINAYLHLFDGAEGYRVVGEVSPRYLYFERACERIKHYVPEAQVIAVLRHPVERAYSHFLMNRDRQCEPEANFRRAIEREKERADLGWGWDWRYVEAGLYHKQLERYFQLFGKEKMKIFLYEEYSSNSGAFFTELFDFLGVDSSFRPDTTVRYRTAGLTRSYAFQAFIDRPGGVKSLAKRIMPTALTKGVKARIASWNKARPDPLTETVRQEVFEHYFEDDCKKLEGLIGKDLSQWTQGVSHGNEDA